jgi:hypothetical protein
MSSDPLHPPGPALPRPYYAEGKPLWLRINDLSHVHDWHEVTVESEHNFSPKTTRWYGPFPLPWERPSLAALLEAAADIDRIVWGTCEVHEGGPAGGIVLEEECMHCQLQALAARLRSEAGKGETDGK